MRTFLNRSLVAALLVIALVVPQLPALARDSSEPGSETGLSALDTEAIEVGLSRGDRGAEVEALQGYLQMAGHLSESEIIPGVFDERTERALEAFQAHHQLPNTGTVTEETRELLATPRFDDLPDLDEPAGDDRALAYVTGNKWSKTNLTYAFKKYTPDLGQQAQRAAIREAFDTWMAVTPLVITEVGSVSQADIVVSFESGAHGDPCSPASACAFDGPGGVLAHAFFPPPNGGSIAGDTHFDEAETWTLSIPAPAGGINLKTVAIHEFGHALGLGHSSVRGAIMYPYYTGIDHDLHSDDIAGIQSLYGPNSSSPATVDAEVVSITMSPTTVNTGASVTGKVQVRNNGSAAAAIPVTVTGPNGFSQSLTSASLGTGKSATLSFTWTASTAGTFSFTATAGLSGDSNSGNDSKTSNTVTVKDSQAPAIDAAVTAASASPKSIVKGSGNVTISATVRNNGSASASVPVTVSGPNGWSASASRTIAAGSSSTVTFAWPANVTGTHTFTVSTGLAGDQVATNNSKTTGTVQVTNPQSGGKMLHVSSIAMSAGRASGRDYVDAIVSVGPTATSASGARVTGRWTLPGGKQVSTSGTVSQAGTVTFQLSTSQTGTHTFQVQQITKTGHTYNSALDSGNPGVINVGGDGVPPPPPATIDAAVTQVAASPTSLKVNSGNVTITATIANNGTSSAAVPVTISGPGGFSDAKTVSLGASASAQVTFAWPASVTGSHTFIVKTSLAGDGNTANNQSTSPTVSVTSAQQPPAKIDAGIAALTRSPASVQQNGTTVTFTASARNYGSEVATVAVRLSSSTAGFDETRSVTIAPGATQTVQFQWRPTVTGTHTFTATSQLSGDSNAANNSRTTTVTVSAPKPASNDLFVYDIRPSTASAGWVIYVDVRSTTGATPNGATVQITVKDATGKSVKASARTDAKGTARISVRRQSNGMHTATVDNITLSGSTYKASLNKVTTKILP